MSFYCLLGCGGRLEWKRVHMKKVISLLLSVALILTLAACSADEKAGQSEGIQTVSSQETSVTETDKKTDVEVEIPDFPVVYTDYYGNETTIAECPSRIVSLSPALTEIIYSLDCLDRVVGVTNYDDYPAEVWDLPKVGDIDSPSIEDIVALEPDLVVASSIFSEDSYNELNELGIDVAIVLDEDTFEGTYDIIRLMSEILGVKDKGEELVTELDIRLRSVVEAWELQDATLEAGPSEITVYYCMSFGEFGDFTGGGDSFIDDIISYAGGINLAHDVNGWMYSVEALVDGDPDVIILSSWVDKDAFITTEPYSELTAVKNGFVYSLSSDWFERQGPRNVDAVEALAVILRPDMEINEMSLDEYKALVDSSLDSSLVVKSAEEN